MIAIDQSRKRGTSTGWNVVERENEGHSQSQLYHEVIPDICHESHENSRVNFFLAGVNFYRFNAKNWQFTV